MTHDEATKNHPGGETDKESSERETRLYSTGKPDDAFASVKQYVSKLNPLCNAFFQRPRPRIRSEDPVWYENKPLGVNSLGNMMKSISTGCNLSKIYTNHSVRATAIICGQMPIFQTVISPSSPGTATSKALPITVRYRPLRS